MGVRSTPLRYVSWQTEREVIAVSYWSWKLWNFASIAVGSRENAMAARRWTEFGHWLKMKNQILMLWIKLDLEECKYVVLSNSDCCCYKEGAGHLLCGLLAAKCSFLPYQWQEWNRIVRVKCQIASVVSIYLSCNHLSTTLCSECIQNRRRWTVCNLVLYLSILGSLDDPYLKIQKLNLTTHLS